jgi:hypothetical protein
MGSRLVAADSVWITAHPEVAQTNGFATEGSRASRSQLRKVRRAVAQVYTSW